MSVVGKDYEKLKRFNLAEIYEPTPKPDSVEKSSSDAGILQMETSALSDAKSESKPTARFEEDHRLTSKPMTGIDSEPSSLARKAASKRESDDSQIADEE